MSTLTKAPPVIPEGYRVANQCVRNEYTYKDYVSYLSLHHIPDRISLKEYQRIQEEQSNERI
jgi:hypothetical protein